MTGNIVYLSDVKQFDRGYVAFRGDADDVNVHLYRSMIGSLMYLTASRPKIMFVVCAFDETQERQDDDLMFDTGVLEDDEMHVEAKVDKKEEQKEQKLARKQEEEANIALIESWENTQAMMEADRLLAERLQSKEREELTDEEKAKLFMELMEKSKKSQFSDTQSTLKEKTYLLLRHKKELKCLLILSTWLWVLRYMKANEIRRNEVMRKQLKGVRKRKHAWKEKSRKEQQKESLKKQKVEEEKELEEVNEIDEAELKKILVIKIDEDIAIDVIPLATKLPVIIDYKLYKEGMLVHYQLIRADESSKRYSSMIRMLQGIDKEDLEALWRTVKAKYGDTRPDNEFERVLWGDLKVMFKTDKRSDVWRILQGYRVTIWKLIDSSGVHFVRFDNLHIFMFWFGKEIDP
ncbi:hypothetical protein Tco_0683415 [Tanacetum coccineum]|uniref:Uncharacterized protein n=1 Tax=Tanacetum coccineum TaxID=301880 RepID=A0ABQ4XTW6_9ASTR